jgi:hypothetical protein
VNVSANKRKTEGINRKEIGKFNTMLIINHQDKSVILYVNWLAMALMMEATITFETSVNFYQTARSSMPKDRHFHTRRLENLKSLLVF